MHNKYLVSVVVPVYKVENFVADTIDSVIKQTIGFENIQLIIVNDGSPDKSDEICLRYAQKYPDNILYIEQKNSGVSVARNNGLDHATGEYVFFLDSDDMLTENCLEELVSFMEEHPECNIAQPKLFYFDAWTGVLHQSTSILENRVYDLTKDLIPETLFIYFSFCIFRTNVLKESGVKFEKLAISEDLLFINEFLICNNLKYGVVETAKLMYRKRSDGTSAIDNIRYKEDFYRRVYIYKAIIDECLLRGREILPCFQNLILNELNWYREEIPEKFQGCIDKYDMLPTIKYVLSHISDEFIMKSKVLKDWWLRVCFLHLKYGDFCVNKDFEEWYAGDYAIAPFNKWQSVTVSYIHEIDNVITVKGEYRDFCAGEYNYELGIRANGQIYKAEEVVSHKRGVQFTFLNKEYFVRKFFEVKIPFDKNTTLEFLKLFKGKLYEWEKVVFSKQCRFRAGKNLFYVCDNTIFLTTDVTTALEVVRFSTQLVSNLFYANEKFLPYQNVFMQYINRQKEYEKKRLWVFAEQYDDLYNHFKDINDEIEKYHMTARADWDYVLCMFAERIICGNDAFLLGEHQFFRSFLKCGSISNVYELLKGGWS